MSLLLRGGGGKDARGGQTSRPTVPNNNLLGLKRRDPAPRFTSSGPSNHGMRLLSTDITGGDSTQVMLQRKVVTPNPSQRQLVGQKQQGEQQHGVISMEEVMNDLRLLEEQQREAQRKVAIMKLNKQQKEEQQERAEQSLASLRYSNAQQREQLERFRHLLSVQTRELGSVKLQSSKATSDLKRFDDKLQSGLQLLHDLSRNQRIMETKMVQLENYSGILARIRDEAETNLEAAKVHFNSLEHKESLLIKTIQSYKNDARALTDEVLNARSSSSELEEDLRIAAQMETRTKINLETKIFDAESDEKRHRQVMEEKEGVLQERFAYKRKILHEISLKKALLEEKQKILLQLNEHAQQIQKQEGTVLPSDEPFTLNIADLKLRLEEEERLLAEALHRRDSLTSTVESLRQQALDADEKASANFRISESQKVELEQNMQIEEERTRKFDSICMEIESERDEVEKLQKIVSESTNALQHTKEEALCEFNQLVEKLDGLNEETVRLSSKLKIESGIAEEVKKSYNATVVEHAEIIRRVKEKTEECQSRLHTAEDKIKTILEAYDDSEDVLLQLSEAHQILLQKTLEESSIVIEEHPSLATLNLSFDVNKTEQEQSESALAGLLVGCQARLDRAYDDWTKRCEEAWHQQRLENIEKEKQEKRRAVIVENSRRAEEEETRRRNEKKERLRRAQEEENRRRVEKEEISHRKLQEELMQREAEVIRQQRLEEKREQEEEDRRKLKRREERLKVQYDLLQKEEASKNHELEVQKEYNKRLRKEKEGKRNEVLPLQMKKSGVQRMKENALPVTDNVSSPPKTSTKRRRIFGNIDKEVENGKKKRNDCWNEGSNALETANISVRVPLRAEKSLKKNNSSCVSLPEVRNNDADLKGKNKAEGDPAKDKNKLSDSQRPAQSKRELEARNVLKSKTSFTVEDKRQEGHSYRLGGKTTAHLATSKYYSASATYNSSNNLTGDAAPLVQAALTAASQENDRISQTSTNTRSRHKNGHQQKQKKA